MILQLVYVIYLWQRFTDKSNLVSEYYIDGELVENEEVEEPIEEIEEPIEEIEEPIEEIEEPIEEVEEPIEEIEELIEKIEVA